MADTESLRGLVEEYDGRFRSSNSIPVDRIWLTKGMWEQMRESLLNQAPAVGQAAEGWVLVPRAVSSAMEAVYANDSGAYQSAQELHDAMLSAAPAAPVIEGPPHRLAVTLQSVVESARCLGIAQCGSNGDAVSYWTDKVNAYVTIAKGQTAAPVVEVDEAMVERASRVVCERAGETWDHIGAFARDAISETQRAALAAALGPEVDRG